MFKTRKYEEELMDLPETGPAEFNQALEDIQWVNRHLRGTEVLVEELFNYLPASFDGQSVLDIGTGSADIPLALAKKARQSGQTLRITAVDLHPVAVASARRVTADYPEIEIIQGNALALSYEDQAFDWTISSLFMHHLEDQDAVRLLREMARLSQKGFIINDLERHPCAYWGIRFLGMLTRKGRIFLNDAPLSVLRGFTRSELKRVCDQSRLSSVQIQRKKPFRWVVTWIRSDGDQPV